MEYFVFALGVVLPFVILLAAIGTVAAIVRRRRYRPKGDDWQDWSAKAARQRQGEHFDHGGQGGF